ncbi:MAG: tetratricopeptide repeat protein [Bryobacterales bacterium]|nr:tetratricopeptide repeat protein [Bryobacterales bacterium]
MKGFSRLVVLAALVSLLASAETAVVLPYFNLTRNKSLDWVGESVSESLNEALGSAGVLVIDRDERDEILRRLTVKRYALLTQGSVMEIAMNLDADVAVWGEIQAPAPGAIAVVTRVASLKMLKRWPPLEDKANLESLSSLQARAAWHVLHVLSPAEAGSQMDYLTRRPAVSFAALEDYTKGLQTTVFEEKHRFFTAAVLADASFSLPLFQLGILQFRRKDYRTAADWLERVAPNSSRYRESQFFLGLSRYYTGNFGAARDAFARVSAEVPLAEVLNNLGAVELRLNQPEALDNLKKALDMDPSDPAYHFNTGYALWKRGDFEGAAARFRATLDRAPDDQTATLLLGRCLKQEGPRPGDLRTEGQERVKTNYDEAAWRQLKAVLKQ